MIRDGTMSLNELCLCHYLKRSKFGWIKFLPENLLGFRWN